jgi:alkanesulfonate monooxygenase SsuD/methylene tetrahydromethanopterin reductase-like flavin-dependent oxidoreductase (luciferase family)
VSAPVSSARQPWHVICDVKLGLTLPCFVDDPAEPLAVARAAEAAGLDGVFVFDHLFRRAADGSRRPALESTALLGAVAAATSRVSVGALVSRASMRPGATLASALETADRIAPGRVVTAIGAGDTESREENETFGLPFGTIDDRIAELREAVIAVRDRGFPVWVGGDAKPVRAVAAEVADGWNAWSLPHDAFARDVDAMRAAAVREPFTCSWGGLVVLGSDDAVAQDKANRLGVHSGVLVGGPDRMAESFRRLGEAGAAWVIAAPIDSRDARNAEILGTEVRARLMP